MPGWVGLTAVLLFAVNFGLLIAGPQTWRATPWAWGWLWLLLPPEGGIAFLLLAGPLPGAPLPRTPPAN